MGYPWPKDQGLVRTLEGRMASSRRLRDRLGALNAPHVDRKAPGVARTLGTQEPIHHPPVDPIPRSTSRFPIPDTRLWRAEISHGGRSDPRHRRPASSENGSRNIGFVRDNESSHPLQIFYDFVHDNVQLQSWAVPRIPFFAHRGLLYVILWEVSCPISFEMPMAIRQKMLGGQCTPPPTTGHETPPPIVSWLRIIRGPFPFDNGHESGSTEESRERWKKQTDIASHQSRETESGRPGLDIGTVNFVISEDAHDASWSRLAIRTAPDRSEAIEDWNKKQ
ncbi:hypothetical protein NL676_031367 [Syzygium grande]|nr:hypothetical protein NL676_031367 [Syzygium grande]